MVKINIRNVHFLLFLTIHCKFHTDHGSRWESPK
jgi:hypothetical protein